MELLELLTSKAVLALILLFAVGLFLALREVFCWYYKINKIVNILEKQQKTQEQTNILLRELNNQL
ncbi:hypothetical protein [Candidatus Venteria ishoeyi]|uniref:Uncharacterized protein n=1 Tax=Candidatus Venteria ishoeyi TaxID=1899563 RepID=A0A1H6F8T6_9GAMM|nr:hypothetical protein [Candidatus Venteria ishoeyi]SEH05405.1 Uncharacterised protein [Candidatus Venteria ishoeyi]